MFQVLLLEDDAVSAAFLADALEALPAKVRVTTRVSEAIAAAATVHFDLLVFDAQLPDGKGGDALAQIRERRPIPALALSADLHAGKAADLARQGFETVLAKPIPVPTLLAAARALLPRKQEATTLPWDDRRGLAAIGGRLDSLLTLRGLFLAELSEQSQRVRECLAAGNVAAATAELHKLKASCGFVGAAGLLEAVRALAQQPASAKAQQGFFAEVERLLANPPGS